jgi:hypothetical protein
LITGKNRINSGLKGVLMTVGINNLNLTNVKIKTGTHVPGSYTRTSSGTFTVPIGMTSIEVIIVGGGGGGAVNTTGFTTGGNGGSGLVWFYG